VVDEEREQPHHPAPDEAIQHGNADLLAVELGRIGGAHLPQRDGAHDHGGRLVARVAADAGDDGHQRRQRHDLLDRALEDADHARGDETP